MDERTIKAIAKRINTHPEGDTCDFCRTPLPIPKQFYTICFDENESPEVTLYCKACSYKVIRMDYILNHHSPKLKVHHLV